MEPNVAAMEAEMAVQSSIAVRERYKDKLKDLIASLKDHGVAPVSAKKIFGGKQKQPKEKLLQVIGDWLLLVRAASVDVVEAVERWWMLVNDGIPKDYVYDDKNYLLEMTTDLDFLDKVQELRSWLGFSLLRNPFITSTTLDDSIRERFQGSSKELHAPCMDSQHQLKDSCTHLASLNSTSTVPPAKSTVKQDTVKFDRIVKAQMTLIEEEGMHGRVATFRKANAFLQQKYKNRTFKFGESKGDKESILMNQKRHLEHKMSAVRKQLATAARILDELNIGLKWMRRCQVQDLSKASNVWKFKENYRKKAMHKAYFVQEALEERRNVLQEEMDNLVAKAESVNLAIAELQRVKKEARQKIEEDRRQQDEERMLLIRARKNLPKVSRSNRRKEKRQGLDVGNGTQTELEGKDELNEHPVQDLVKDINMDEEMGKVTNIDCQGLDAVDEVDMKQEVVVLPFQINSYRSEPCRLEAALMKREDLLSKAIARHLRIQSKSRETLTLLQCPQTRAVFSTLKEFKGQMYRISVYDIRGYEKSSDIVRITANRLLNQGRYILDVSRSEFLALQYPRNRDGMSRFCNYLYITYDQRERKHRLVWAGDPCPTPLRIRDSDPTLVCLHKEGVRLPTTFSLEFAIVAAYIRTTDTTNIHFVVSYLMGISTRMDEVSVSASNLIIGNDLLEMKSTKSNDSEHIAWRHKCEGRNSMINFATDTSQRYIIRLSKFGMKIGSSFYVCTLSILRPYESFKARMHLSLTATSSLCRVHELTINISEFLRCQNVWSRLFNERTSSDDSGCPQCSSKFLREEKEKVEATSTSIQATIKCCDSEHEARMHHLQHLLQYSKFDLNLLSEVRRGHCSTCDAKLPTLVLFTSPKRDHTDTMLLELLSQHFATLFESTGFVDLEDIVRQKSIVVIVSRHYIWTVDDATAVIRSCSGQLNAAQVPYERILLVNQTETASGMKTLVEDERPESIESAIGKLMDTLEELGSQPTVHMSIEHATLNFEAYLVSEALLVEAARVVLQPEVHWRPPSTVVGASSWECACEFLQNPLRLSSRLMCCHPLQISQMTKDLVYAYAHHSKRAIKHQDVRSIFHPLLDWWLHFLHVIQLANDHGGVISKQWNESRITVSIHERDVSVRVIRCRMNASA